MPGPKLYPFWHYQFLRLICEKSIKPITPNFPLCMFFIIHRNKLSSIKFFKLLLFKLHFLFTIWTHIRIFACLSTFFRVPFCFAKRGTKRAAAGAIGASSRATDTAIFPPYMGENGRTAAGCVSGRFWGVREGGLIGGWVRLILPPVSR